MMQEFVQQVVDTARGVMEGMHTAIPGKVVEFDAETCTATVQPQMKYRKPDGTTIDYPNISGVPVVIPQSAGQSVTIAFPIRPGDGGLIIAAEQSLDYWMYEQETDTNLRFDLTNAIFIPGLFNKANAALVQACSTGNVVIQGSVIINGSLTVTGGVVGGGISLGGHTHTGNLGSETSAAH